MLDVGCLIRLQRPLPCGFYPLSCELQMGVIARLRNFNMVNILSISNSFNIILIISQPFTDGRKYVKCMVLLVILSCSQEF